LAKELQLVSKPIINNYIMIPMKTYHSLIAIAFLLALTSCFSPKPVMRFKPEETKTTWDKGKEYVSYKRGEYEVHSSYYGNNDKYIMFDIEIVNNNGEEFLVAPEEIKLYTGKWNKTNQCVLFDNIPVRANDPEMELLNIDLANSKAEASRKNAQVAAVAIFAAAIPLAIVAAKSDIKNSDSDDESASNTEMVDAGVNIAMSATAITQINEENKIISMNDSKYSWETSSLRKTTLSPGYSIRGLVFFPIPETTCRKIKFDIPVPEGNITFKYDYILYYPQ
jgi:hypothetical protein